MEHQTHPSSGSIQPAWNAPAQLSPARPLFILDLDETLWYGREHGSQPSFEARPMARKFVLALSEIGQLGIWTAATRAWADEGLRQTRLFEDVALGFRWSRERCTMQWSFQYAKLTRTKRLQKLGRALKRTGLSRDEVLAIDDSPAAWSASLGNLLRVPAFQGGPDDVLSAALEEVKRLQAYQGRWRRIHKRAFAP